MIGSTYLKAKKIEIISKKKLRDYKWIILKKRLNNWSMSYASS
ncbi:protein of unknown function [Clostridium beijerinckii]|nr:protein of unknown function [Clostridium beijerinckii]